MDKEERIGFGLLTMALIVIPFFFVTAVLGSYREVQSDFLTDIMIFDVLITAFPWDAVVVFFTSILVYGALIYIGWIGFCLYKGKANLEPLKERFIDIIYNRSRKLDEETYEDDEEFEGEIDLEEKEYATLEERLKKGKYDSEFI